jgi:hypothetical protein
MLIAGVSVVLLGVLVLVAAMTVPSLGSLFWFGVLLVAAGIVLTLVGRRTPPIDRGP